MNREEFEKIVESALAELPDFVQKKMDNIAVVIEDQPSHEQNQKGRTGPGSLLLGLYEGVPKNRRGVNYNLALPDKISIFQKNIETVAGSSEAIKEQVKSTVWHEFAHHFGFSEEDVRKLAHRRGKPGGVRYNE